MDISSIIVLIGFVGTCFLAAMAGAMFRPGDWYEQLRKPAWRPPNWVFPPAWAFLYLTIAVSGWLVWLTAGLAGAVLPLAIYLVQLVLNAAWTPIFFRLERPGWALVELAVMLTAIVVTILVFAPWSRLAAALLVPYFAWVCFATYLTAGIVALN